MRIRTTAGSQFDLIRRHRSQMQPAVTIIPNVDGSQCIIVGQSIGRPTYGSRQSSTARGGAMSWFRAHVRA